MIPPGKDDAPATGRLRRGAARHRVFPEGGRDAYLRVWRMPLQSQFSSLPLRAISAELADLAVWHATVDDLERRWSGDIETITRSRALLASGAVERLIDDLLALRHQPSPARRIALNKAGRKKKIVYQLPPLDELLCRVLNRVLQPRVAEWISPTCHSFQHRRSAVTAFASLLAAPQVSSLASLHVDIADFFNSIDVEDLLERLPAHLLHDRVLRTYLQQLLRDERVQTDGGMVRELRKGVMAGTPLAPLLSNLYLRELDGAVDALARASARYSDDMLVLGTPAQVIEAETLIRDLLHRRGLAVNEGKTRRGDPGAPWDFLGLRYAAGAIGLSANTQRRLRGKVRRRARRLARYRVASGSDSARICSLFVASLNRTLYGVRSRGDVDFSWARWFFPLLTTSDQLGELDAVIQQSVRWAACGSRRARARALVPYSVLHEAGYLPLLSAFHAYRHDPATFAGFLEARCAKGR